MRPCLKRGARALFNFRLRFPIRDSRAVLGTRAVRPVVHVKAVRQHRRDPVWRYPCGDCRDRLAARLHPALVRAQQMRNRNFLIHHRINSSSHLIPLPERDRSKRGHAIRTALPSDAPHARRRLACAAIRRPAYRYRPRHGPWRSGSDRPRCT